MVRGAEVVGAIARGMALTCASCCTACAKLAACTPCAESAAGSAPPPSTATASVAAAEPRAPLSLQGASSASDGAAADGAAQRLPVLLAALAEDGVNFDCASRAEMLAVLDLDTSRSGDADGERSCGIPPLDDPLVGPGDGAPPLRLGWASVVLAALSHSSLLLQLILQTIYALNKEMWA